MKLFLSNKNKSLFKSNTEEINDTREINFNVKDFSEIIKNPNCLFTNEIKKMDEYYFCLCSEEAYFQICRFCAIHCHKDHNPTIKIYGHFVCMCGKKNHEISNFDQIRYENKNKKINKCIYNEFLDLSLHKKIFVSDSGKKICSICIDINCDTGNPEKDNSIQKNNNNMSKNCEIIYTENTVNEDLTDKCHCHAHDEINVVTFKNELLHLSKINNHILNFNFNIFLVSPSLKKTFIDFLNEKLEILVSLIFTNRVENINISNKRTSNHRTTNVFLKKGTILKQKLITKSSIIQILKRQPYSLYSSKNVLENMRTKNKIPNKKHDDSFGFKILQTEKKTNQPDYDEEKFVKQLEDQVHFFSDFVNNSLFEIFFHFEEKYSSQFLHIKNIFYNGIRPKDLLNILSYTILHRKILEKSEKYETYFSTKISFALVVFKVYIKSHYQNFNNILNFKSVLNLNIFQRYIYLFDSKNFYKLSQFNNKNIEDNECKNIRKKIPFTEFNNSFTEWENFIFEFANRLLDILDFIIILDIKKDILYKILGKTIDPICKIFKFFIKYNLIDNELKEKYYEFMEEIIYNMIADFQKLNIELNKLLMDNSSKGIIYGLNKSQIEDKLDAADFEKFNNLLENIENIKDNIWFLFQVIKSIFYYLVKINDDIVIENLRSGGENLKKNDYFKDNYSFQNSEIYRICKIFIFGIKLFTESSYLTHNNESIYKKKILKMDLYIKKILELLIGNNEFYIKSLDSLLFHYNKKIDKLFFQEFEKDQNNYKQYIDYLNSPYMKNFISNFKTSSDHILNAFSNLSKEGFYSDLKFNLNKNIHNSFNEINSEFGDLNKKFYEYEISFPDYILSIIEIFGMLEIFMNSFSEHYSNKENFLEKKSTKKVPLKEDIEQDHTDRIVEGKKCKLKGQEYSKIVEEKDEDNAFINREDDQYIVQKNLNLYSINESKLVNMRNYFSKRNLNNNSGDIDGINNKINFDNIGEEEDISNEKLFFKNLENYKKINEFKQFIGYTDFIENLNEFIDIYSKTLNFSNELKELDINNSYIKFILKFIFLIIQDNYDNIALIMALNPKKFVDTFSQFKLSLVNFVERLAITITKNDYFDNYHFITELINHILKKINIDEINGISKNDIRILSGLLKAFKKLFNKYNLYNNEIINTFELLMKKITLIKTNPNAMKTIENYFIEVKNLNDIIDEKNKKKDFYSSMENITRKPMTNNEDEAIESNKLFIFSEENKENTNEDLNNDRKIILKENKFSNFKPSEKEIKKDDPYFNLKNKDIDINDFEIKLKELKIFEVFIKNYFSIINIAIEKDLFYHYIVEKKEFKLLLEPSDLFNKIKNINIFKISFREKCEKFMHNFNLKTNVSFFNLDVIFSEFQKSNENKSKLNSFNFVDKSNLIFSYNLLKEQMNNFSFYIDFDKNKEDKLFLIKMFSYIEYSIINPLYKLLNLYLSQRFNLNGEDYFKIYELVYTFHQRIFDIYKEIEFINFSKQRNSINYVSNQNDINAKINSINIYCDLKRSLNLKDFDSLKINMEMLKSFGYYELENLINLFRATLMVIKKNNTFKHIYLKKQNYKYKFFENVNLEGYNDTTIDEIFLKHYEKILQVSQNELLDQVESKYLQIINIYKKNLSECDGNQFSLIKCFEYDELDVRLNFREVVIEYLLNKFGDGLTDANKDQFIPQNKFTLNPIYSEMNKRLETYEMSIDNFKYFYRNYIEGQNLKLQNFYALFYLRNLFFHDSSKFQKTLLLVLEENDVFEDIVELNIKEDLKNNFLRRQKSNYDAEKENLAYLLKHLNTNQIENQNVTKGKKLIININPLILESLEKIKNYEEILNNDKLSSKEFFENTQKKNLKNISLVKKFDLLINIITKYFIFGPLCIETNKIYEISSEKNIINYDINYDYLISSINLIHNICESHDPKLQNILYDLRLYSGNPNNDSSLTNISDNAKLNMKFFIEQIVENINIENILNEGKKKLEQNDEVNLAKRFLVEKKDLLYSYVNFNFTILRKITYSVLFDYNPIFLFSFKDFRNNMNLISIYKKITNLIVEMIQGTEEINLLYYLKPEISKEEDEKCYQFLNLMKLTKDIFLKKNENTEKELAVIKKCNFFIANSLLNHKNISKYKITNLIKILDINLIMNNVCYFVNKIILRYQYQILYEHPYFNIYTNLINYQKLNSNDLYEIFLNNFEVSKDNYFELCVEMFYHIIMMSKKIELDEAIDIIKSGVSEDEDNHVTNKLINLKDNKENDAEVNINIKKIIEFSEFKNNEFLKINILQNRLRKFYGIKVTEDMLLGVKKSIIKEKNTIRDMVETNNPTKKINENKLCLSNSNINNKNDISKINNPKKKVKKEKLEEINFDKSSNYPYNKFYVQKFFNRIIQTIEVAYEIRGSIEINEVYFIKQPMTYLINKRNRKHFFDELADRTDAISKINCLLDSIQIFEIEVEYKLNNLDNKLKMFLIDIDFKYLDMISLLLSFVIILVLFLGLDDINFNKENKPENIYSIVLILGLIQIFINICGLAIFIFSKYNLSFYYVINKLIKEKFSNMLSKEFDKTLFISKLNNYDKFRIYFLESILLNEDAFGIIFNILIAIIGISNFYANFLFSLQLLTIYRFVLSIKNVIQALLSRYRQLLTLLLFLVILINFYSNICFYFMKSEFDGIGTGFVSFFNLL